MTEVPKAANEAHPETLLEREISYIRQVLEQTGGNRTQAAERLGITRRGLIYKIKRYGL